MPTFVAGPLLKPAPSPVSPLLVRLMPLKSGRWLSYVVLDSIDGNRHREKEVVCDASEGHREVSRMWGWEVPVKEWGCQPQQPARSCPRCLAWLFLSGGLLTCLGLGWSKECVQQSAWSNAYLISVTFIRASFSSNHRRASVSSGGRSGSLACLELRLRNVRIGSLYVVARMLRNDRECPPCVHSQEHDF